MHSNYKAMKQSVNKQNKAKSFCCICTLYIGKYEIQIRFYYFKYTNLDFIYVELNYSLNVIF